MHSHRPPVRANGAAGELVHTELAQGKCPRNRGDSNMCFNIPHVRSKQMPPGQRAFSQRRGNFRRTFDLLIAPLCLCLGLQLGMSVISADRGPRADGARSTQSQRGGHGGSFSVTEYFASYTF